VLDRQNLLVVDPRGRGGSGPLRCARLDPRRPRTIRACARRLGPRLQFFSTNQIAADMNAVREALGLPTVTFHGGSYGTLYAQAFASRFPAHTTALFLNSVIATRPDGYARPEPQFRLGVPAYARVCRASQRCRAHAAPIRARLARLVRRLRARPDRPCRSAAWRTSSPVPRSPPSAGSSAPR
jgi:pimeloyl-ACP methyl ester carboxylesterase